MTQTRAVYSDDDLVISADANGVGAPGDLVFKTGGVERARITVAGVSSIPLSTKAALLSRLTPLSYQPPTILTSDAPTVTVGTSNTISGRRIGAISNDVRFYGPNGSSYWDDPNLRAFTYGVGCLDFFYTGQTLEIGIRCNVTGVVPFLLAVDGLQVTSVADQTTLAAGVAGTIYYVKLAFGSSKTRRIEFNAGAADASAITGVFVGGTDGVAPAPVKPNIAWISDSFWSGVAGAFVTLDGAAFLANRTLGGGLFLDAIGGTGYSNAGASTTFWSATRAALVRNVAPELIVVQGSTNDDGLSTATVGAAAAAMYADIAATLPGVPVIVFGAPPNAASNTISANRSANIAAVKAAAIAAPNVIGFHDECGTATSIPTAWSSATAYVAADRVTYRGSVWKAEAANTNHNPVTSGDWSLQTYVLYGTGKVGTVVGDGNRDTMLYSDGTHPTAVGQQQWAAQIASEIRADFLNYALGGAIRVT